MPLFRFLFAPVLLAVAALTGAGGTPRPQPAPPPPASEVRPAPVERAARVESIPTGTSAIAAQPR